MRCWLVRRRLLPYEDGDLPAAQRADIERHLSDCRGCAAELTAVRRATALVQSLDEADPGPAFTASVLRRVRSLPIVEEVRAPAAWPVGAALGLAGCLLSAALIVAVLCLDVGGLATRLADLLPAASTVASASGSLLVSLVGVLDTAAQVLGGPMLMALGLDVALLGLVLVCGRRLLRAKPVPAMCFVTL